MALDRVLSGQWGPVAPDRIHQAADADGLAVPQRQHGQHRSAPQPPNLSHRAAHEHINRPEQPYLHMVAPVVTAGADPGIAAPPRCRERP